MFGWFGRRKKESIFEKRETAFERLQRFFSNMNDLTGKSEPRRVPFSGNWEYILTLTDHEDFKRQIAVEISCTVDKRRQLTVAQFIGNEPYDPIWNRFERVTLTIFQKQSGGKRTLNINLDVTDIEILCETQEEFQNFIDRNFERLYEAWHLETARV